jgi:hypothetical protein
MRYAVAVSDEPRPGDILNKMNIYMSKEYRVLERVSIPTLEGQINELASQGWELSGNMSTVALNGSIYYTQVMVREKKDINEVSNNGKQLLHG